MGQRLNTWFVGTLCLVSLSGCMPYPIYHSRETGEEADQLAPPDTSSADLTLALLPPRPTPFRVPLPRRASHQLDPAQIDTGKAYQIGLATLYAKRLEGRRTASGERYNRHKFTAAHRDLPLGTQIRVTNLENGRWVEVEVNDRGPFSEDRILDLSFAAAKELGMLGTGTARVMIEVLDDLP